MTCYQVCFTLVETELYSVVPKHFNELSEIISYILFPRSTSGSTGGLLYLDLFLAYTPVVKTIIIQFY